MTNIEFKKHKIRDYSVDVLFNLKNKASFCWRHFGELVVEENNKKRKVFVDQVFCNECLIKSKCECEDISFELAKIKSYNKTVSTGNLTRHLRDVHGLREEKSEKAMIDIKQFFNVQPRQRPLSTATAISSTTSFAKIDSWLLARDLALWFCKSLLPFDSLSDVGMIDFFKKYNIIISKEDMPSRDTVSRTALDDVYESMLKNVQNQILVDAARHVAVTFDLWTDQYRRLNYITFTLHYLTIEMKLKAFTLCTKLIEGKKTGEKIQEMLNDAIKVYNLNGKEIHTITDSGSNVKKAVSLGHLDSHLCLGHGLHNLVTVDGIKSVPEIEEVVKKVKKIVKAIRYRLPDLVNDSEREQIQFLSLLEKAAEQTENDEEIPITEEESELQTVNEEFGAIAYVPTIKTSSPTRWHSVLEMLESILHLCNRKPVNNMLSKIEKHDLIIKQVEWNLLEDLVRFLRKFREVVEVLSSQKSASLNLALVFRTEIQDVLNSLTDEERLIMTTLKNNMLSRIDKRFPITDKIVVAALLDPRFAGLRQIDSFMECKNTTRAAFLANYIKKQVKASDLVAGVRDMSASTSDSEPVASTSSGHSVLSRLSKKYSSSYITELDSEDSEISQECWKYLATMRPGDVDVVQGNILIYWKEKEKAFPWLNALARALLAIPATSTPSERVFSVAGLVVSAKRSRLSPVRVNKIIFIHDNYELCKENA